ncbi:MAG: AAA family ATPase [Actinobacteria bacterium]|nr:AAA family ATPase [Actinomycetota bacterium]
MIACSSCGHDAPDGATSCPNCRAQLIPFRRAEQRRIVTTLFCDLVGFTALSERNDAEVVNALLRRYYAAARRVVESYGGAVEKYIGDAVVAVFGVPSLHEDDAERAVRAALRLVDEIDALAGIGGEPLEVRVGVNTGEALVDLGVDPASGEGFLTGDAVNVAARLQAAAPPMAVVVGEATHAATEKVFGFDACHDVALKGKSEPLRAWIATAPLARTGSELRSFTTSFVGREDELATLLGLHDHAASGRAPQLGLIVGEPGIGKSRLLAEFGGRLNDQPASVTWRQGRCLPFGSGVTFWALSEIVRACAGVLESDGVARTEARLETVLPQSADHDTVRDRLRPLLGLEADEASREENFSAWRAFLEGLAQCPTVLVVEDLHWADDGMLAFMDYLAASTAEVPLLLLATSRPEVLELTGAGAGFVASARRVALGPLSGDETAQLVLACLGAKSLPVSLQATLLERSGGNPLFAEELVRLLEDRDLLVNRGGQTMLKEGAELPTPDSIGALIAARLDLLSSKRKALLADAAVVGRTFWAGAAAAVGGHDPAGVFEGLHELVAKELVRPVRGSSIEGESEFLFVHALVCDVAYGQLTRADRAAKHAALARWLEGRAAGRSEDLAEILAYHYGTALEMAAACGLFELEDELSEPTSRYLALAGGRTAPLDATAAEHHFARARKVAEEAQRPKRRWLLSRRTRRTIRRRAPLLVAAAAVIAVAAVAALAIWAFMPSKMPNSADAKPSGPVTMTPSQIEKKYGPSIVRITAKAPVVVNNRVTWKQVVSSGFVASKNGAIFASYALFYRHWGDKYWAGKTYRQVEENYSPNWVKVEFVGAQGQYTAVRGFVIGWETGCGGLLIHVDPRQVHLVPIPLGDAEAARKGETVVALSRQQNEVSSAAGTLTHVVRGKNLITGEKAVVVLKTDATFPEGRDSSREPLPFLGGPLIDASGRVVAVMGPMILPHVRGLQSAGCASAISAWSTASAMFAKIYRGRRACLSFDNYAVVTPGLAKALGLAAPRGMLVQQTIDAGGTLARAGIRGGTRAKTVDGVQYVIGGDLIVEVDGKPFRTWTDVDALGRGHTPGDTVSVTFYRGHRLMTVKAKLDAWPWTPPKA